MLINIHQHSTDTSLATNSVVLLCSYINTANTAAATVQLWQKAQHNIELIDL